MLALLAVAAAGYQPATSPKTRLRRLFEGASDPVLACPISQKPLRGEGAVLGLESRRWLVGGDGARYPVNPVYADLLPTSATAANGLTPDDLRRELLDLLSTRVQTGTFRSPLTAFLYERGWRQNFASAGFPGIDKEYAEVLEFFKPARAGVVVDMSCGSGLMTRRLLRSNCFKRVLALDYSEAMLTETKRRVDEEGIPSDTLTLCRADVASLPLQNASVDAMHAGAAMHCWPRLEEGLREIVRVLKPDGLFFATTFLKGAYGMPAGQSGGANGFRFFDGTKELEDLLVAAGFPADGVQVRKEGRGCAIIRACKAGRRGLGTEVKSSDFVVGVGEGVDV